MSSENYNDLCYVNHNIEKHPRACDSMIIRQGHSFVISMKTAYVPVMQTKQKMRGNITEFIIFFKSH